MRRFKGLTQKQKTRAFNKLLAPARKQFSAIPSLEPRGDRPLQMTFEDQLNALVYFHLEEFKSGRHLLQALEQNNFAKEYVAPSKGIKKSAFFEAINTRGLEQLSQLFTTLVADTTKAIPAEFAHLGNLVSIDGSLIDAVMSMEWADYPGEVKKAKAHIGFDINRCIPTKIFLTDGLKCERPFVEKIIAKGQTGVMDRGYQCHRYFDQWQTDNKQFVCRIQERTAKKIIRENAVNPDSIIFYDAVALLGSKVSNQTEKELRVVGYRVEGKEYWVATNRHDLSAEDVAQVYKLRWSIETFFAWWKRHLKVYHLIARSPYGLMVQILGGLITYLLLAIYCQEEHGEKVSIQRVRELRIKIANEAAELQQNNKSSTNIKQRKLRRQYAKT